MALKTVVIGASPNPERYAFKAVSKLTEHGHIAVPVGIKPGEIAGIPIRTGKPAVEDVHTVSLYVGPARQPEYYDYILGLSPSRIIMNPGTENDELKQKAESRGIEVLEACTLVLLSTGQF